MPNTKKGIIKRAIDRTEDRIQDTFEAAKGKIEDAQDSTIRYIKKNPVKSVLIAAVIGAVVATGISVAINSALEARRQKRSFWQKYNPFS